MQISAVDQTLKQALVLEADIIMERPTFDFSGSGSVSGLGSDGMMIMDEVAFMSKVGSGMPPVDMHDPAQMARSKVKIGFKTPNCSLGAVALSCRPQAVRPVLTSPRLRPTRRRR